MSGGRAPGAATAAARREGLRAGCLALDAMGVIYAAADDVAELLVPFVKRSGGTGDGRRIERAYRAASLGLLEPDQFWRDVGLDPSCEDAYLSLHRLTPGLELFVAEAHRRGIALWCLSNDVSRWSEKLRRRFALEHAFRGFVVSGDVGIRKPDRGLYEALLRRVGCAPERVVFVDDREQNVAAARAMGIVGLRFTPNASATPLTLSSGCLSDFSHLLAFTDR